MGAASWLRRNTLCRIGFCPMAPHEDEKRLWAECALCGRRSAEITRTALRQYIERIEQQEPR